MFTDHQRPCKVILVLAALRHMSNDVKASEIPPDTLVMHRETLLNMYGPTLAALAHLDDADLDVREAAASKKRGSAPKRKKLKNSNMKDEKIAAPQL